MAKNFKDLYQNMSLESQQRAEAKAKEMMEEMLLLKPLQTQAPTEPESIYSAKSKQIDD